ncbi:uncharacterized protein PV06_01370 [Exophiala oligosperma]|uniref:BTB domain-containing protein n=1 Tax=Exophiala oligosperma TaxID=215243 RepID=A0A0D2ELN7_9EURO|nr:uncharacterized protein PV06_01370 [Exophiala oligosperma]KIW48809.1 hypothetical protein PV06_01370 [Exophiala oligosperma]
MATSSNNAYLGFLIAGKYTDFIIQCQNVEFKVHRIITAESGRITFPEIKPDIMARVILFMYSRDYNSYHLPTFYMTFVGDDTKDMKDPKDTEDTRSDTEEEDGYRGENGDIQAGGLRTALNVNALMYQCADMLDFEDLKQVACRRFIDHAKLVYGMDGFEEPLRVVYESTREDDKDLRFQVTCLCIENCGLLARREKTAAVVEEYNPHLWAVSVEVNKRKMSITRAVDDLNDELHLRGCKHLVPMKRMSLKVSTQDDVHSITMKCQLCSG